MAITRRVVSTLILTASLAAALIAAGCAQEKPLLNQPLAWAPTNTLNLGVTQGHGTPATVRFETLTDSVSNPALIGENVEQAAPRQVTTGEAVAPFVSQHLQQLFTQAGYIPGGDNSDRVISGEVRKFFVREGSDYAGSVVLNLRVSDRSGKVLWRGTAWGSNQTFGRSYHLDNYQQVLSDSLVDAADNLLKDPALRKSLTLSQ